MYDHHDRQFGPSPYTDRFTDLDEPDWSRYGEEPDDERRRVCQHPTPPRPAHEQALDWLCGLVGGPDALDALTDATTADPEPPTFGGPEDVAAYDAVAGHLDRVGRLFFDEDANRVLAHALGSLWSRDPGTVRGPAPAQQTAGGLVWVVGRANGLFGGGLTQTAVQRELWLEGSLATAGQPVARVLRGIDLYGGTRPRDAPDLRGFANAALLTTATRRTVIRWRDQARAVERVATDADVLPSEVES